MKIPIAFSLASSSSSLGPDFPMCVWCDSARRLDFLVASPWLIDLDTVGFSSMFPATIVSSITTGTLFVSLLSSSESDYAPSSDLTYSGVSFITSVRLPSLSEAKINVPISGVSLKMIVIWIFGPPKFFTINGSKITYLEL